MAASTAGRKRHSQPSRKTKGSWRKNINIDAESAALEAARDEAIQTGGKKFADLAASDLFQTDTCGSSAIKAQIRGSGHGHLKADQIIASRSKVPAIPTRVKPGDGGARATDGFVTPSVKRKRGEYVSQKEMEKLKRFAFSKGQQRETTVWESDLAAHDPWAEAPPPAQKPNQSYLPKARPLKEPETLRRAPHTLLFDGKTIPNIRKPDAGRSYNPRFEDWADLLEKEGSKEVEAEKERLRKAAEEQERQARAAEAKEEAERHEMEAAAGGSDYESEWDGVQSELDEGHLTAKRPVRKTPAERNKIKRRKEAERQAKHASKMREREKQERQMDQIKREAIAKQKQERKQLVQQEWDGFESDRSSYDDMGESEELHLASQVQRARQNQLPHQDLEIVLPEELQDSLRLLKPEGNLLRDRFRNMILQGKMEPRKKVGQVKQPKRDLTEKWSYKDWELPRKTV